MDNLKDKNKQPKRRTLWSIELSTTLTFSQFIKFGNVSLFSSRSLRKMAPQHINLSSTSLVYSHFSMKIKRLKLLFFRSVRILYKIALAISLAERIYYFLYN